MTETAPLNLYGTCRFPVTTPVVAILAGLGLAAPAQAQGAPTLTVFEQRCFAPMAEVRATDTSGLSRIPHRAAWESWAPQEPGTWELRRALPDAVVQYCAIHGPFGDEVAQWAEEAVASGRFIRIDRVPETLQSTTWREPRIEVEIDRDAAAPSLTVVETNLEG